MKIILYFLLFLTVIELYSENYYEKMWEYQPNKINLGQYTFSDDYKYAYNLGTLLVFKPDTVLNINIKFPNEVFAFSNGTNKLYTFNYKQRKISVYNCETNLYSEINGNYIDTSLGIIKFINERYLVLINNSIAEASVYDLSTQALISTFSYANSLPCDNFAISNDNKYFAGVSGYSFFCYNLSENKLEYKDAVEQIGKHTNFPFIKNDSILLIVNDGAFFTYKLSNGELILSKECFSTLNSPFFIPKGNITAIVYKDYYQNNLAILYNYLTETITVLNSDAYELSNNLYINNSDTLFYSKVYESGFLPGQPQNDTTYMTIYNYGNKTKDTIIAVKVIDTMLVDKNDIGNIYSDKYLFNWYSLYNLENMNKIKTLPYNNYYYQFNDSLICYTESDSAVVLLNVENLSPADTLYSANKAFEEDYGYTFLSDNKYFNTYNYIKDTQTGDTVFNSYYHKSLHFFNSKNKYMYSTYDTSKYIGDGIGIHTYEYYRKFSILNFTDSIPIFSYNLDKLSQDNYDFHTIQMSSDNQRIIYYQIADSTIRFRDISSAAEESIKTNYIVNELILSEDDKYLALVVTEYDSSIKQKIVFINLDTKEEVLSFENELGSIYNYSLSANFSYIVLLDEIETFTTYKIELEHLSVEDLFNKDKFTFNLYPNPAVNSITINSDFNIDNYTVYSLNGEKVFESKNLNSNSDIAELNALQNGTYYIKAKIGKYTISKMFVICK